MKQQALGMIETKGLVPAIEAGDAGVKAANVKLLGYEIVKGGLVLVAFTGEVAAVKASVEAGSAAAARVGQVISEHVIPRPEADLRMVFKGNTKESGNDPLLPEPDGGGGLPKDGPGERVSKLRAEEEPKVMISGQDQAVPDPEPSLDKKDRGIRTTQGQDRLIKDAEDLSAMKVGELRKLARKTPGVTIHGREISRANKEQLIEEILRVWGRKD